MKNDLRRGSMIQKWFLCSRLDESLGHFPLHTYNISLVLNISTGLMSLQHYIRHYDFIDTNHYSKQDIATSSIW